MVDAERQSLPAIAPQAIREGKEYHLAFFEAIKAGLTPPDDPRLRIDVVNPSAFIACSKNAFLAEAELTTESIQHWNSEDHCETDYRSSIALQRKMIHLIAKSPNRDHSTKALQSYAENLERLGLDISQQDGHTHLARNLLRFAIKSADRSVLDARHLEWDGLVTPIATQWHLPSRVVARGLLRDGKIPKDDLRLTLPIEDIANMNRIPASDFYHHVQNTVWGNLNKVSSGGEKRNSRQQVIREINHLPSIQNVHTNADKNMRQSEIMACFGRISERMALNLHEQKADELQSKAIRLMAISMSCVGRSNVYSQRAEATQDAIETQAGSSRKKTGLTVME